MNVFPQAPANSSPSPLHQWAPTHVPEITLLTPVCLTQVPMLSLHSGVDQPSNVLQQQTKYHSSRDQVEQFNHLPQCPVAVSLL